MNDPLEIVARYRELLDARPPLPREIAVSDQATLDALLAGMPAAEASAPWANPLGNLLSIPIRLDDTLPPGQLHVREHDGRVSAAWELIVGGRWLALPTVDWPDAQ